MDTLGKVFRKEMNQQEVFETVYRGRQSALHHMAYMRMCKVLLALDVLRAFRWDFGGKSVFDYGFGAGTFFRYCPKETRISGVEMDSHNVADVAAMLRGQGYSNVNLQKIELPTWKTHPLLERQYDLFLCSHVLEHLPEPAEFLKTISPNIADGGIFLGLVPINEIQDNPHHVQKVDREVLQCWADAANYQVLSYIEADEISYPLQPLYTHDSGLWHKTAQAVSLGMGVPATLLGSKNWWAVSGLTRLLGCKPTQAAFLLKPGANAGNDGG